MIPPLRLESLVTHESPSHHYTNFSSRQDLPQSVLTTNNFFTLFDSDTPGLFTTFSLSAEINLGSLSFYTILMSWVSTFHLHSNAYV